MRQDNIVSVKVDTGTLRSWKRAAQNAGVGLSAFIRKKVGIPTSTSPAPTVTVEQIKAKLGKTGKEGYTDIAALQADLVKAGMSTADAETLAPKVAGTTGFFADLFGNDPKIVWPQVTAAIEKNKTAAAAGGNEDLEHVLADHGETLDDHESRISALENGNDNSDEELTCPDCQKPSGLTRNDVDDMGRHDTEECASCGTDLAAKKGKLVVAQPSGDGSLDNE
jgi:hypothetical protein